MVRKRKVTCVDSGIEGLDSKALSIVGITRRMAATLAAHLAV